MVTMTVFTTPEATAGTRSALLELAAVSPDQLQIGKELGDRFVVYFSREGAGPDDLRALIVERHPAVADGIRVVAD